MEKIAIICGHGSLPVEVVDACLHNNREFVLLGFHGHSDEEFIKQHPHEWFKIGQVGSVFKFCRKHNVKQITMAGRFHRVSWNSIKPDAKGAIWLAKLIKKSFGDDSFLRALIQLIENEGYEVISPDSIVGEALLADYGVMGVHQPSDDNMTDIKRGIEVIEALGQVDVGQATIVQQGMVLGVEALEGTNELIKRCGLLQRDGAKGILVKFTKPAQDTRADRPTTGLDTVKNIKKAGFDGLAIEAGGVIMLDKKAMIEFANQNGIFLIGVKRF